MSTWTAGYVAELNYTHGFYRELAPSLLAFVALAQGQRGPDFRKPLTYCELGCGQGFSANIIAAANPNLDVFATDFNPAQIAGAQTLAAEAGISNVHFSDASFEEYLADDSLPQFDFIALHGIYSWVSAANRKTITDFVLKNLKVGGLVYISYNVLPGWSAGMPLRRLFIEHSATTGGTLPARIEKALTFAGQMKEANAAYFRDVNGVAARLEGIQKQNRNYLAHEFFNKDWTPMYFADVAQELGEAKLSYLGSAHLLDHIDAVNFSAAHQALVAEIADPAFRETARDYLTLQQFRRDVFVRGARPLAPAEIPDRWQEARFALTIPSSEVPYKVAGPVGQADLQRPTYEPIVEALGGGPKTGAQLAANPVIQAFGWPRLQEALKVLVGSGWVQPCLAASGDSKRAQRTKLLNDVVIRRSVHSQDLLYLASPVTGSGVAVDRFQQMFLLARQEKRADPVAWTWSQIAAQGHKLLKDGAPLENDEDNLAELRSRYDSFVSGQLPVLERLGVA